MSDLLGNPPCCSEIKFMLSPYFDGELPDAEMKMVENHLANCPECLRELEKIEELSMLVGASLHNRTTEKGFDGLLPEEIQKCLKITSDISTFIDGELDQTSTRAMLEHVIACKFCRKQYDKIKKTSELTKKCLKLPVMDDIQAQKMHEQVINRLGCRKNNIKMLSSAAAVVFIAFLGWFSISHFLPAPSKDAHIDNTKYVKDEKPLYVQAEGYVLSDLELEPPEELVLLIYGDKGM